MEALEFYGDLMTKYKAVVPDAITWEFDEIVAGGQNDRYAMTMTLAPVRHADQRSAELSKTGGRLGLGADARCARPRTESRTFLGGWTLRAWPPRGKHKDWAFEFIQMACSKEWMQRSMRARQCAAAGLGAERSGDGGEIRLGAGGWPRR